MRENYLWDRTGAPDPEIVRLEQQLEGLGWRQSGNSSGNFEPQVSAPKSSTKRWWALAAALAVGLLGAAIIYAIHRAPSAAASSWRWSDNGQASSPLRPGEWIRTSANSRATIKSDAVGEVQVAPNSRLRLLAESQRQHRISLAQGTIHALIWAPPTRFVVDIPSAKTVDLGCQYSLSVSGDGNGFLKVELGWVAFQWRNVESFIPAGAACVTRAGHGPDTPYFLDAPKALIDALAAFDRSGDRHALTSVLNTARHNDALTLWHLLQRTQGDERRQVFSRFAKLVTLPPGVSESSILRGEPASMDAAWNALQLGNTSWWREWKRNW